MNKMLIILTIFLIFIHICPIIAASPMKIITGKIIDDINDPVVGASVIVSNDDQMQFGGSTNILGEYSVRAFTDGDDSLRVRVQAIGFKDIEKTILASADTTRFDIALVCKPLELDDIIIMPDDKNELSSSLTLDQFKIISASRLSLIATDPIQAIRQPQVIRAGSSHSAKIRVNGTSPKYFINGQDMGFDPNHYGMFSIIPSSVISEIMFYPQGTEAVFNLPSAVEMMTSTPYNQPFDGEIDLSFLEATMALAWGSERYFVLSSLRKSVLDKLADHLDDHSTKKKIPPTNFQDVFISSGINISKKSKLILDQYYVRDFLSYKSDPSRNNPEGVDTHQKTSISFAGIRYETVIDKLRLKAGAAWKTGHESYFARPYTDSLGNGFNVDLKAESRLATGFWQGEFVTTKSRLCIGGRLEYTSRLKIDLNQVNWNFLPPDYISDNPYIYQDELNRLYGKYHTYIKEKDGSLYIDYQRLMGRFEIQTGIRTEYFGNLADKYELVYRNSLTLNMGSNRIAKLFFGTYAENPANRITEPYQVLVHDNLDQLQPIKTRLLSLSYGHNPLTISIFSKRISNRPMLTPDYDNTESGNSATDGFLRMSPRESINFYGGDINFRLDGIPFERINLNGYYGYTRAERHVYDLELPFSLVAPHRFYLQAEYMLSKMIKFGGDINIRSGYAYTPPYSKIDIDEQERYSDDFYSDYLIIENSQRFPTYLNINLYFGLTFRNLEIYLNTLNVTNHSNPIISSSDGYIYDTGFLPSLGIKYKF